jgi:hypothetical protein
MAGRRRMMADRERSSVESGSNAQPKVRPAIGISVVAGGPKGSKSWREPVMTVVKQVLKNRDKVVTPLGVAVTFFIPGEHSRPDFAGLRTGTFSRKESWLAIQVALPDEPIEDGEAYVFDRLVDAVEEAERFAVMEALPDCDLSALKQLIISLKYGQSSDSL